MSATTTRRGFMVGCSSAIAALAGSRFSYASFADPDGENRNILLYIFLRGGMDGLSLVPPIDGPDRGFYEQARPELKVATGGEEAALDLNGEFGLHRAAASLLPIFQEGKLAFVLASGLDFGTRSHFDAMQYIELGTPGKKTAARGWLARHLESSEELPDQILAPSIAMGSLVPRSLLGSIETMVLDGTHGFDLDAGDWRWQDARRVALRGLYESGNSRIHRSGVQALNAVDIIESYVREDYTPAEGVEYPRGSFGDQLEALAQIIKLEVGLRVATIDLGGWDTHAFQNNRVNGYFGRLVSELADGLSALYRDLEGSQSETHAQRLTVVVQSEFGRRLRENDNEGTDHGHGNVMMVLGGEVAGGIYGQWPGLHHDQLFDHADLAVTTDYRQVLSEIMIRRLGNPRLGRVFPGYQDYAPLGIVTGPDLTPDYS